MRTAHGGSRHRAHLDCAQDKTILIFSGLTGVLVKTTRCSVDSPINNWCFVDRAVYAVLDNGQIVVINGDSAHLNTKLTSPKPSVPSNSVYDHKRHGISCSNHYLSIALAGTNTVNVYNMKESSHKHNQLLSAPCNVVSTVEYTSEHDSEVKSKRSSSQKKSKANALSASAVNKEIARQVQKQVRAELNKQSSNDGSFEVTIDDKASEYEQKYSDEPVVSSAASSPPVPLADLQQLLQQCLHQLASLKQQQQSESSMTSQQQTANVLSHLVVETATASAQILRPLIDEQAKRHEHAEAEAEAASNVRFHDSDDATVSFDGAEDLTSLHNHRMPTSSASSTASAATTSSSALIRLIRQLQNDINDHIRTIATTEQQVAQLKFDNKSLNEQLTREREQHEVDTQQQRNAYNQQLQERHQTTDAQLVQHLSEYTAQLNQQAQELLAAREELSTKQQAADDQQGTIEQLRTHIAGQSEHIQSLHQQLQSVEIHYRTAVDDKDAVIAQKNAVIDEFTRTLEEVKLFSREKDAACEKHITDHIQTQSTLNRLLSDVAIERAQSAGFSKQTAEQVREYYDQINRLQARLHESERNEIQLHQQLNDMNAESHQVRQQLEDASAQNTDDIATIAALRAELAETSSNFNERLYAETQSHDTAV